MTSAKGFVRRLSMGLLAVVLACSAGCAVALVGAAAGAGAAGYLYYNGLLYREYKASLADTTQAVRAGLAELQFPISKEKTDTGTAYMESKTADGLTVSIYLNVVPSSIPAEGAVTRVSVRVGFAGDDKVSSRILDAATKHLPASGLPPLSSPIAAATPPVRPVGKSPETSPPPLAKAAK